MNFRFILLVVVIFALLVGGFWLYQWRQTPSPTRVAKTTPPAQPPERPVTPATKPPLLPDLDTPLPPHSVADRILVEKKARRLTLFYQDQPLKSYQIALGRQPEGPKRFEGDNKTPEGRYTIDWRNPNSKFHRSLHISYPNPADQAFAAQKRRSAGGDIMIHGLPNGWGALGPLHLRRDWTAGCIAVTNSEIEEIWRVTPDGVPIEIRP